MLFGSTITILMIQLFLVFAHSTDSEVQTKYLIPSYYGSRDQDFLIYGFAIHSNYSSFYWTHGVDLDDNVSHPTYYFIDSSNKQIRSFSSTGEFTTIASTSGGFRNGKTNNALFSSSLGLAFYRQNKRQVALQQYRTIIVLSDNSDSCKARGISCQNPNLVLNSIIDPNLLYEVYNVPSYITLPDPTDYEDPVLIIADTGNHCIRKIDLTTKITTTVAGQCTIAGFQDGPFGTNLMTSPTSLGVDSSGIIFFYDGYNDYIRMVDPITTFVSTLLKGACRQDIRFDPVLIKQKYYKNKVLCYKNWLNLNQLLGHTYSENLSSICQLQQSLCSST